MSDNIPNFDFASMYPTVMMNVYNDRIKMKKRRMKLDKILNNINDENII